MDCSLEFNEDQLGRGRNESLYQSGMTFYGVPNHFPTLSKALPKWLPRQLRTQNAPKPKISYKHPLTCTSNSTSDSVDINPKRFVTPKLIRNSVSPEYLNTFRPRELTTDNDQLKQKIKMISLCDELDFKVRKIPSFQVKAIPSTSVNKYMARMISPLRNNDDGYHRVLTGKIKKTSVTLKVPMVERKEKKISKEMLVGYCWRVIRESNGLDIVLDESKSFKFYVGSGNNSSMVVRILRNRPWWVQTDNKKDANLVWTSLKHPKTMRKLQGGKKIHLKKKTLPIMQRRLEKEAEKFGFSLISHSQHFVALEVSEIIASSLKICNKLEANEQICSKKLLFANLKEYFESISINAFDVIPITFHIGSLNDPGFKEFEEYFSADKKSIWIIKPGENTNRGNGISVSSSLSEIRALITEKTITHTCIIQKYIERPLLINRRKFDIRCFALLTSINSNIQGYFYTEGYIRTASKEFSLKNLDNKFIHLTNDAIQKNSDDYGKFEPGNKLSYNDLQGYIDLNYPRSGIRFEKDILGEIKKIVEHSFRAVYQKIDPMKRLHSFELFGYDFMVDENFHVWLIEANTNPCLETSCAFLSRVIPACIENTFKLVLDPIFPPILDSKKSTGWIEDHNISNQFELIFNEFRENDNLY